MDTPPELVDVHPQDTELLKVAHTIRTADPRGERWAHVVRHTYDVIYNGQETGRYRWDQLMKTERTHFGTLFEIYAQREFEFPDGDATDFRISGVEVDAKWSQREGGWMLPPEVFGRIALVATGSDVESRWSLGLVRVSEDVRRVKANRDAKTQLSKVGRQAIHWLWRDAALPPNVLLQLPTDVVDHVFDHASGTQRISRLFEAAEGMIVSRTAVATVGKQLDAQKRVRYNGGARGVLQSSGYIILSGVYHRRQAEAFGVPVPRTDEYVSIRVVPSEVCDGVEIDGRLWRRAQPNEHVHEPAPRIG